MQALTAAWHVACYMRSSGWSSRTGLLQDRVLFFICIWWISCRYGPPLLVTAPLQYSHSSKFQL